MANLIARARGYHSTGLNGKEVHKLGSIMAEAEVATYKTIAHIVMYADGHGYVRVERDGVLVDTLDFGAE